MAEILELEEVGEIEAVEEQEPQNNEVEEAEIPEKYRGKSAAELVRMHQEAEKLVGKQAQEVGEVRKLADELLKTKLYTEVKEEKPEIDFFENPKEATRYAVENNPRVLAVEEQIQKMQRMQAKQALMAKHPDAESLARDEKFLNWVKDSPMRTEMFQRADSFDLIAADELLSTYKAFNPTKQTQNIEVDKDARAKTLKSASVDTGGAGGSSKKVYSRAALRLLNARDPNKYQAMLPEVEKAYAEGRIKD